jgi:hypothetical protein
MTELLPELAETLPVDVQLDGELVALNHDGARTSIGSGHGCCTGPPA